MRAEITTKPSAHKMDCMLCGKPVKKGDNVIKVTQTTYPGYKVGYICYCRRYK